MNHQYPLTADGQQRRVQARRQEVRHVHRGRGAVQRARGGAHDAGNHDAANLSECTYRVTRQVDYLLYYRWGGHLFRKVL